MTNIVTNALETIGHTPLIALDRIHAGPGRILAKMEFIQPGGSVKDRAALKIIERAYAMGQLSKGQTVVEMTSGNMGAGLAVVCNVMQNPFVAVMSAGNSPERAKMLRNLGTEVVLVPQVDGQPGQVTGRDIEAAAATAKAIVQDRQAYYVDQFNNPGCALAHEEGTGPELWQALGTDLQAFVAGVGSGGTFIGTSRFLKRQNPATLCVAVEPEGAEVPVGKAVTKPKHILQGMGYGIVPPQWEARLADAYMAVSDEEAAEYRGLLARREGLYVGFSAAANVCAAVKFLQAGACTPKANIVTVLCDTGLKY